MLPLFNHQKHAVEFFVLKQGNCFLHHDPGLGKTRSALEAYKYVKDYFDDLKLLIICPLSLLEAAWHEDVKKFTPEFSFWNLHKEFSFPYSNIYAINYEAFIAPRKLPELTKWIKKNKVMCVCDESSRMKGFKSITTKTILDLADLFVYRIAMSGTPAPNSLEEFWGQMEFVKPGILGKSFYGFRNTFFHMQRGTQIASQGKFMTSLMLRELFKKGFKYQITDSNRKKLMSVISPMIHRAKKEECLDLPEQIDEVREVTMSDEQAKIYKDMKTELVAEIGSKTIAAQTALTKLQKLSQICSGFSYMDDEAHALRTNPKMDELQDLIEDIGDKQIIIWINYHWEANRIKEMLGNDAVVINATTKDKEEAIFGFRDGKYQYAICHPRSVAHGVTWVNCSYHVYYSLDWSWEMWEQSRCRTHRAGAVNPSTYYVLVCKNTIDEIILETVQKKGAENDIIEKFLAANNK